MGSVAVTLVVGAVVLLVGAVLYGVISGRKKSR